MGSQLTRFRKDKYEVQAASIKEGEVSGKPKIKPTVTAMPLIGKNLEEFPVCDEKDILDNEMKEFTVNGGRVLLVKENGRYSAIGAKCTHYGAPLAKGVLKNGVVRCPWHGACFNSKTGDIEDFPGLDSLPKYEVIVSNGKIHILAKRSQLESGIRQKAMVIRDPINKDQYVIVGAGAAAANCAETLRQEGYSGRIVMVSKENNLPYDRVKLSKAMDSDVERIYLRNPEFYKTYGIEFIPDKEVTDLSVKEKIITFHDGHTLNYDKMLLATGGIPRRLDIPGSDLANVVVLRSIKDANNIARTAVGKNVAILGLSFIGMESAAFLVGKAASVTMIGSNNLPFASIIGQRVAARLKEFFEEKGVIFSEGKSITEFIDQDGILKEVVLDNGSKLSADLCLLGIGVNPATDFLKGSDVSLSPEGYVLVDKNMRTNIPDVYAAGDITKFPLFLNENKLSNVQHWQMALSQGHISGLNMAGKEVEIHSVPFFWTMFFGISLRYTGYAVEYDDIAIRGSLNDMEFVAYYLRGDKVVALASMKTDPIASRFAELLRSGRGLLRDDVCGDCQWLS